MKRRQVRAAICSYLLKNKQGDLIVFNGKNIEELEKIGEEILSLVEKKGMRPPGVKAILIRGKDFKFGGGCSMRCNCDECNPDYIMNEWESE